MLLPYQSSLLLLLLLLSQRVRYFLEPQFIRAKCLGGSHSCKMSTTTELEPPQAHQAVAIALRTSPAGGALEDGVRPPPEVVESEAPLTTATIIKLISCAFAFFLAGVNDGSVGALIPYMLRSYDISTGSVTATYAAAFPGWIVVAIIGGYVSGRVGMGGALVLGAASQLLGQVIRIWASSFGVFAMTFFFTALGQAFQDSQANTFVSSVKSAHRWLGVIHASYGFGCLIGPLVATAIASSRLGRWQHFYYFLMGLGALNLALVSWAFRKEIVLRQPAADEESTAKSGIDKAVSDMKLTVKLRTTWTLSLFYFFYLGAAITVGGWLVEYLVKARKGQLSSVGYVATGYYGGVALGRLALVEPTHRFGERPMLLIYSLICLVLQVIFWRVKSVIADAIVVSLMGFLLGPYFAAGVSVGTKLLPKDIHAPALSLIFVIGQSGGTLFPVVTGVITAKAGVGVLQPIVIGLLVATAASWALVPRVSRRLD
jgi:fucose permease